MKQLKISALHVATLFCVLFGLTACGDDEPNDSGATTLETPAYESVSAKYDITSPSSKYQSIELTASGNYIIIENLSNQYTAPAAKRVAKKGQVPNGISFFFNGHKISTRNASSDGIIYGKYTKISDTEFELEGFGKITIEGAADNAYSLTIAENGKESYTLTAAKSTQNPSGTMTSNLCRTWKIENLHYLIKINGATQLNKTFSVDQFEDQLDMDKSDYPEQVVFTKAGTYMVYYADNTLAVSTWAWENESNGVLRYSWDYDDMYDDEDAGLATIIFNGAMMHISESYEEVEDGEHYAETLTWGLSEVK